MYKVEVKAVGGWTRHSEWDRLTDAMDQADMVRGRVVSESGNVIMTAEQLIKLAISKTGNGDRIYNQ